MTDEWQSLNRNGKFDIDFHREKATTDTAHPKTATLVVVVEDNRLVRDGLAALLGAEPDFEVVAAVENAVIGLQQIQLHRPQVVLVDATLPNRSSHRLLENVRATLPQTRVIVMDLLPLQQDVIEFIQAGASGFIVKDATVQEFIKTVRQVASGEQVVPASVAGTLLTHIAQQAVARQLPGVAEATRMTKREREIVVLIAEGLSNKEIARRMSVSPNTIKSHVHNILEKLTLHSRLQIAAHAFRSDDGPATPTHAGSSPD